MNLSSLSIALIEPICLILVLEFERWESNVERYKLYHFTVLDDSFIPVICLVNIRTFLFFSSSGFNPMMIDDISILNVGYSGNMYLVQLMKLS